MPRQVARTQYGLFSVDPLSGFGVSLLEDGEYEPQVIGILQTYLRPGATFIDAGANEGFHTVCASRLVGPTGRVVAIEPQSRLMPILEGNLAANRCDNVHLVRKALSDREGSARLYLYPSSSPGASSFTLPTRYWLPSEEVATVTLASIFDEHGIKECDLLKMDIEGAEALAIPGAEALFRDGRIRAMVLEPSRANAARVSTLLNGLGYRSTPTVEQNWYRQVWTRDGPDALVPA